MCAIVGSFDYNKLLELIVLNSYRGSHSYSFSTIDPSTGKLEVKIKQLGAFQPGRTDCQLPEGHYGVVHIQAPTTDAKRIEDIHPARDGNTLLWHNGIIKSYYVKTLQALYGQDTSWDTELLLRAINNSRDELFGMDGSFSCLWYADFRAYLFRNDISPMFYDDQLNISSTRFNNSMATDAGAIHQIDFANRSLYNTGFIFSTVDNPYYLGEEI